MRVYVSGSIRDVDRVRAVMREYRDAGHTITHDWTRYGGPKLSADEAQRQLRGIASCDRFVLVVHPRLKAGWMEFGAAVVQGKAIVVLPHPDVSESMWYALPGVVNA